MKSETRQTETRYVGTNWDEVKVSTAGVSMARKVITRDTHRMAAGEMIAEAIAKLRQGFEVRFTDGKGDDALRLYPCVAKGTNHMETTARTMGTFKQVLNDKLVESQRPDGTREAVESDGESHEPAGVTPDIIMTCEVCGHRQRVSRKH